MTVQQILQCAPPPLDGRSSSTSSCQQWQGGFLPTGFQSLDQSLGGGLRAGQVAELVGPAGSLKSQVAVCAAARAAMAGQPVWVISSRADELARRIRQVIVASCGRDPAHAQLGLASASNAVALVKLSRCFNLASLAVAIRSVPNFDDVALGIASGSAGTDRERGPGAASACGRKRPRLSGDGSMPPALVVLDSIHTPAAPCVGPLRVPSRGCGPAGASDKDPPHVSPFGSSTGTGAGASLALVGRSLRALARRTGAIVVFSNGAVPSRLRGGAAQQAALGSALAGSADVVISMWPKHSHVAPTDGGLAPATLHSVAGWRDVSARLAPVFVAADTAAEAVIVRGACAAHCSGADTAGGSVGGREGLTSGAARRAEDRRLALRDGMPRASLLALGAGALPRNDGSASRGVRWAMLAPMASAAAIADGHVAEWPELAFTALRCAGAARVGAIA